MFPIVLTLCGIKKIHIVRSSSGLGRELDWAGGEEGMVSTGAKCMLTSFCPTLGGGSSETGHPFESPACTITPTPVCNLAQGGTLSAYTRPSQS